MVGELVPSLEKGLRVCNDKMREGVMELWPGLDVGGQNLSMFVKVGDKGTSAHHLHGFKGHSL